MFKRMFLSFALVLSVATAACVESDQPTESDVAEPAPRVVEVPVDVPMSLLNPDATFSLAPEAICGRTFCSNQQPWTVCYCPLGSGLYKKSTCSQGCNTGLPPGDPTD